MESWIDGHESTDLTNKLLKPGNRTDLFSLYEERSMLHGRVDQLVNEIES